LTFTKTKQVVERGAVGDSIGAKLGFLWKPSAELLTPGKTVQFSVSTIRQAAVAMTSSLRAAVPEQGQFMSLSMSGTNARRTAATLNAVADQLVSSATDLKKHHVIEFRKLLADQLGIADRELHNAELALESFRVSTITMPSENLPVTGGVQATRDPVFASYHQQKATHEEVRRDRLALERILADASTKGVTAEAFIVMPTMLNRAPDLQAALQELARKQGELRALEQRYTDLNSIVITAKDGIKTLQTETIPQIVQGVLAQLKAQEAELGERIESQSGQLKQIPPRTIEEMRLMRQVQATETLANTLKARYQQVLLSEAETTPDLRILDTAVAPLRPSTANNGPRLMFLAIIGSFGAAIALALLHDKIDRRFRYPEQATGELGLDIAGTVPRFKANRRGELGMTTMSQVVESFRTLRLGVRYQFQPGQPVVVAVTSPGAGEGKSLVSSNLAMAFANAGHKTLLIDGDVRRGAVHKVFDLKRTPGLVEYLCGDASAETVVRATPTDNLFLIPCGSRRVRAPELLVSDRMAGLVNSMREQFDVVILDSPPFAAGMDAYALAAAAGSVLIVLRPAVTDRKLASVKLEVLDRLPVRVLGSVINGIAPGGSYRYYGSDYGYSDEAVATSDAAAEASGPIGVLVRS
jgi:capsular exopolysaccharide synthesis family protein